MYFRRIVGIQAPLFDMTYDANDLTLHSDLVEIDTLAEGILCRERLPLKFLINDCDTRAILSVLRGDEAPPEQRNSHNVQVVGTDPVEQSEIHLALLGGFGTAFDPIRHF